jgi:hypothetical protein
LSNFGSGCGVPVVGPWVVRLVGWGWIGGSGEGYPLPLRVSHRRHRGITGEPMGGSGVA